MITAQFTNNPEYASPNIRLPKYIDQILTDPKGEIDTTIIVRNFNTPLGTIPLLQLSLSRQEMNKESWTRNILKTNGPNIHIQNIPPKSSRTNTLHECMWNILQDRKQEVLAYLRRLKSCQVSF